MTNEKEKERRTTGAALLGAVQDGTGTGIRGPRTFRVFVCRSVRAVRGLVGFCWPFGSFRSHKRWEAREYGDPPWLLGSDG
jgi:hypothetical protein